MISSGELMFYSGENFYTNNINHKKCKMNKNANGKGINPISFVLLHYDLDKN